jgi:molybdenum-dependent DNA-binding transcriptional regulator ModE
MGGERKRGRRKVRRFIESRRALYLATLRRTGNLAAAARAVGISMSLIWQRRRAWPGFRARAGLRL